MNIAIAIIGNLAIVIGVHAAIIYAMTRKWEGTKGGAE